MSVWGCAHCHMTTGGQHQMACPLFQGLRPSPITSPEPTYINILEKLRAVEAERDRLRAAMEEIHVDGLSLGLGDVREIARDALTYLEARVKDAPA